MSVSQVLSSIISVKQDDDNFVPVFPISTANEVYVDMSNLVKLSSYLSNVIRFKEVSTISNMYALTRNDVKQMDIVKVTSTGKLYFVMNINDLNLPSGYVEILTGPVS